MLAIFKSMVENMTEIFIDDFSIFGNFFYVHLKNLGQVIVSCEETILVVSWEKYHYMVLEGIVSGYII